MDAKIDPTTPATPATSKKLHVTPLPPRKTVDIAPAAGYDGCVVLMPEGQSTFEIALYVGKCGHPVPFRVPNQEGVLRVDLPHGFFTSKKDLEGALHQWKPSPPTHVTD